MNHVPFLARLHILSGIFARDLYTCRKKMNEEVLSSQILGKRFSEFPNGSRTHDLPEYRLERSNF